MRRCSHLHFKCVQILQLLLLIQVAVICSHAVSVVHRHISKIDREALSEELTSDKTVAVYCFGFGASSRSKLLLDSILARTKDMDDEALSSEEEEASSSEKSYLFIDGFDYTYSLQFGAGSVALGYLPQTLLVSDSSSFLTHIQAFLDSASASKKSGVKSKIIIVVEDSLNSELIMPLKSMVQSMIEETVLQRGCTVEIDYISVDSVNGPSLGQGYQSILENTVGISTTELLKLVSHKSQQIKKSKVVDPKDIEASLSCSRLCEDFIKNLKQKLGGMEDTYLLSPVRMGPQAVKTTLASLRRLVEETAESNYEANAALYSANKETKALKTASLRARTELCSLLLPFYDRLVEATHVHGREAFERAATKVPPGKRLIGALKDVARSSVQSQKEMLATLQEEFESIMCLRQGGGRGGCSFQALPD